MNHSVRSASGMAMLNISNLLLPLRNQSSPPFSSFSARFLALSLSTCFYERKPNFLGARVRASCNFSGHFQFCGRGSFLPRVPPSPCISTPQTSTVWKVIWPGSSGFFRPQYLKTAYVCCRHTFLSIAHRPSPIAHRPSPIAHPIDPRSHPILAHP